MYAIVCLLDSSQIIYTSEPYAILQRREGGKEKHFVFPGTVVHRKNLAIGVVEVSLTEPFVFVLLFLSDWLRLLVREVSFATALIVGISFISVI